MAKVKYIKLSDAVELLRLRDLCQIRQYEPNVVKAAWAIFGDSYRYRALYNEYKAKRMAEEKLAKKSTKPLGNLRGQLTFEGMEDEI